MQAFLIVLSLIAGEAPERHEYAAPSVAACAEQVAKLTAEEATHKHPGGSKFLYACRIEFLGEPA
jgi:hypothetical protein